MPDENAGRLVVVTGAGGFVGRHLTQALLRRGHSVIGIGRGVETGDWPQAARWLRADLLNPADYASAIEGADCVLHLAALTGKAAPAEFQRNNVDATKALLGACARAGAKRFIFLSSIAAAFADRRHYPYADSKIAAEALVRDASIPSVIVRPTMILGPGSPIEESLARLARLPLAPIFGAGRVSVQPIDVEDVAQALANLVDAADVSEETIELGGPEAYELRELYARLRAARGARGRPRLLQLPLGLARWSLALVEKPLLPLLPLSAGQLATFANDGVAAPHAALPRLLPYPRPSPRLPQAPDDTAPAERLAREFQRHARYVAIVEPTPYQQRKYLEFHVRRALAPANRFDALLLGLSRAGGVGLALADSYSSLLYRQSVVRAKLVLALAILESSPPSCAVLDRPDRGGRLTLFHLAWRGGLAALSFLCAALLLAPAHLALGRAQR
jgi:nucleoside-diphosphate-sugar epimerase